MIFILLGVALLAATTPRTKAPEIPTTKELVERGHSERKN